MSQHLSPLSMPLEYEPTPADAAYILANIVATYEAGIPECHQESAFRAILEYLGLQMPEDGVYQYNHNYLQHNIAPIANLVRSILQAINAGHDNRKELEYLLKNLAWVLSHLKNHLLLNSAPDHFLFTLDFVLSIIPIEHTYHVQTDPTDK